LKQVGDFLTPEKERRVWAIQKTGMPLPAEN
jgi:hypothetical protein